MAEGGSAEIDGHEEFFEWRCKTCEDNKRLNEATSYCKNCDECLCSSCLQYHDKYNKKHKVLGEEEKVEWGTPEMTEDTGIVCSDHPGQTISMYCGQHDDVCCPVCAVLKHSETCRTKMSFIPQIAKGITTGEEFKAAMKSMNSLIAYFSKLGETYTAFKTTINKAEEECSRSIDHFHSELVKYLQTLKESSRTEMAKMHTAMYETNQKHIETCLKVKQELQAMEQQMQITDRVNESLLFVNLKSCQKLLPKCSDIATASYAQQQHTLAFQRNQSLLQVIQNVQSSGSFINTNIVSPQQSLPPPPRPCKVKSSIVSSGAYLDSKNNSDKKSFRPPPPPRLYKVQSPTVLALAYPDSKDNTDKKYRGNEVLGASKVLAADELEEDDEMCVVCMDIIDNPRVLECGHKFCTDCIEQSLKFKQACPTCGKVCGVLTGDQPHGTMEVAVDDHRVLCGYEGCGSIRIGYRFQSARQEYHHPNPGKWYEGIQRSGFLPDNREGNIVLEMLKIAFERKLVFTIGSSRTTGQEGVITWNDIQHKTNPNPHGKFGYPDPTYLERVTDELAAKGVTEKDIPEKTLAKLNKKFSGRH